MSARRVKEVRRESCRRGEWGGTVGMVRCAFEVVPQVFVTEFFFVEVRGR